MYTMQIECFVACAYTLYAIICLVMLLAYLKRAAIYDCLTKSKKSATVMRH